MRSARILALSTAALVAALASGCTSTCEDACARVAEACGKSFEAAGVAFDQAACASNCDGAYTDCEDVRSDSLGCLEGMDSCDDAMRCSSCTAQLPLAISQPACTLACLQVEQVCAADRKAVGLSFDAYVCVSDCVANAPGCSNVREQAVCRAEARSCVEAGNCPTCDQ